ncbi:MAG TPA: DUF2249 domain-containing protein [Gammaproteobacteria bacterium]|nr:DUF2249 domain-containing protein [Gammaproteobacteria bacterium]
MGAERRVDVSDLEAPEPLVQVLDAAERLAPGEYLHMLHRREPCLLYGNLDQRGFAHDTRQGRDVACEVFIWRRGDEAAAAAANEAAADLAPWRR